MSLNSSIHKIIYSKLLSSSIRKRCKLFNRKYKRKGDIQSLLLKTCTGKTRGHMSIGCKVALVNGGTSGIGLAAASHILQAGARNVTITGEDSCQGRKAALFLNKSYGMGKSMFVNCNVNSVGQYEDAFKATLEMYKRLDIVVNAVGICDGEKWEREVITNIVGTIRGTLLAYRYIGKEGYGKGGCVVNISGVSGLEALPSAPTLSASQHAIVGLSRSFGNTLHSKKSGVRVMCLCPGFTKTNFLKNICQKGMTDIMGKQLEYTIKKSKMQKPDACGQAVIHIIQHGNNGSIWLCEGSRLFLLNIPSKSTYSTLVAQYI